MAARDIHVADAVGNGGGAQGIADQSGQRAAARLDRSRDVQVADGGALHKLEGGDVLL